MDYMLRIATIKTLIEFLKTQTRPNIKDVESPEFATEFEQYFLKDDEEEEI